MKKMLGCFLCVMILAFGAATNIQALTIGPLGDADPFVGTAGDPGDTQDNLTNVNLVIAEWNLNKSGDDDWPLPDAVGDFEEFFDPPVGSTSGLITWDGNYTYLTAKYGTMFDVFYLADISGSDGYSWSGSQELSHYRLWNPTSVPEPATMLLLGCGLIGLAGFGRKKFKN